MRLAVAIVVLPLVVHADPVDDVARAELQKRQIPAISLAVVDGGKLVRASAYGVVEAGSTTAVTPTTLFQAGSVSKSIAAAGVLHLVEAGKLSLDDDVNAKLTGWKLPSSDLTKTKKVTLRRILSHTAGLTVHGFPGYAVGQPIPTMEQILDGAKPANTPAIRVDVEPDSMWRYSGGGYTLMQKLVVDTMKTPFPKLLRDIVLAPAGMTHSSYEQPLPADWAKQTATAHTADRTRVPGRWHVYPEMAAAGLWTTPTDLVTFGLELQRALAGRSKVMSAAMARQMMTVVKDGDGLGLFLKGSGATLEAGHNGRDEGFDALFVVFPEAGRAAAIMINTNDDGGSIRRVLDAIMKQYKWHPDVAPPAPAVAVAPKQLDRYAGHYDVGNGSMLAFAVSAGHFYTMANDFPDDELVALATDRFRTPDGLIEVRFHDDAVDMIGGPERKTITAPRVAPPIHTLAAHADPAPAFTAKVLAALQEIGVGKAGDDAFLTPGLRHDLGAPYTPIAGLRTITFVDGWKLPKQIERHGGKVDRIAVYRTPDLKPSFVLAYVTADGKITDFDQVAD